jgi:MFS superfamily sulfate permease-like transporter
MPEAVLGAIVFLIGIDLIDITGLRRIARRRSEFIIAVVTGVVVCAVGVEQGVILGIVLSLVEVSRRQYRPKDFVPGSRTAARRPTSRRRPARRAHPA